MIKIVAQQALKVFISKLIVFRVLNLTKRVVLENFFGNFVEDVFVRY